MVTHLNLGWDIVPCGVMDQGQCDHIPFGGGEVSYMAVSTLAILHLREKANEDAASRGSTLLVFDFDQHLTLIRYPIAYPFEFYCLPLYVFVPCHNLCIFLLRNQVSR